MQRSIKYLLGLPLLLVMMIASGQSSPTLTINRNDALKVYSAAAKAKVYAEMIIQLKTDIESLNKLISLKESEINQYKSKDTINANIIRTYEDQIQVMKDQRALCEATVKATDKLLKRYKRRVFWRTALGVATTAGALYLYISK